MNRWMYVVIVALILIVFVSLLGAALLSAPSEGLQFGEKVAVIDVHGNIVMENSDGVFATQGATPAGLKSSLESARGDGSVKAVVLDINSPGGSVVASEAMAEAINEFKNETDKPVIAWLGEIAASGGYYVASSCDYIVADRGTLTGSIGVISIFPEYTRLLDKLGINMTVIKAGKHKDFSTGYRPMTAKEKKMMEELVEDVHDTFIKHVARGRGMGVEEVRALAQGQVYGAETAMKAGLVDDIGTRSYAIEKAAELGGIEGEPRVVTYTKKRGFFEEIMTNSFYQLGYGIGKGLTEQYSPALR